MTSRKDEWVAFAARRLNALDPLEERLARAVADVLSSGLPKSLDLASLQEYDKRCAAAVVAIVEMSRAIARGDDMKVVKA